jgi:D-arabinose 1-dehydrogenase-like Zn-dependent alcohol dehydrogenase
MDKYVPQQPRILAMQSYDVVDWGKPLQVALKQTPTPIGTEVLVKVKFCGVCHSDVHIRDGYFDLGAE